MNFMVIQAVSLLIGAYLIGAWIGWMLSSDSKRKRSGFQTAPAEIVPVEVEAPAIATRKISNLASMTPESMEVAVQNAGTGMAPNLLSEAQGNPDDLKLISGIGPVNERELHELGIYHYWQMAEWGPEQVAWIAGRIRFPNRITRENWVAQAAKLAERK